jgi:hypothetical protein
MIPSCVAWKGPIVHVILPVVVNGRNNHNTAIKIFTARRRLKTILDFSLAINIDRTANTTAGSRETTLLDMAIIIVSRKATINLHLGSNRCIIEFPSEKTSKFKNFSLFSFLE